MRDNRYRAAHRGGPLSPENHRRLAAWAAECAARVLALTEDDRPRVAVDAARAWATGRLSVGDTRTASVAAHAVARAATGEAARFAARAAGHAAATAHMADHAPGAAVYAVRAVRAAMSQQEAEREHRWQRAQLPEDIRDLVLTTFAERYAGWLERLTRE